MVTPVLHVLPLTIRSTHIPMIALLLRDFRDFDDIRRCYKPVVLKAFLQMNSGKFLFACGALNGSLLRRLRLA